VSLIHTLARDWQAHGEEVIKRAREENGAAYFKGMLRLLPKDVSIETQSEQISSGGLPETRALLERIARARKRNPPRLRCMAELACDRLTAAPEEPWQEIDVNGDLANLESNAVSVKALRQVAMTLEAMPTPL
jgi:hypothetical protein